MNYAGLIIGLGNPGKNYALSRHNIGFIVIDRLLDAFATNSDTIHKLVSMKNKFRLWKWQLEEISLPWLLCQPLTYMNLSGLAVASICFQYKIATENILVIHDELDLAFGKIRFKFNGGVAGHRGLQSIVSKLGTYNFYRLRIGIGRPEKNEGVIDYVLSPFKTEEFELLHTIIDEVLSSLRIFCQTGVQSAMNRIHNFNFSDRKSYF